MRYWLLTSEYPPFYGGGIGTYCFQTATMFADNGLDVSVFIHDPSVKDYDVKSYDKIRVIRFGTSSSSSLSLGHVTRISYEFAIFIKKFIATEGPPDLIEAQEYQGIAYYLLQFKRLLYEWCVNIPVIITAHSPSFLYLEYNRVPTYRYPNFWIGEMERFCLQAADQIISPSHYLMAEIRQRFAITNLQIDIIVNPYQSKDQSAIELNWSAQNIAFYGKLSPQKGTFELLEHLSKLWETGFEKPLRMIGGMDIIYHPEGKTMGDVVKSRYKRYIDRGLLKLEDRLSPVGLAQNLRDIAIVIVPSIVDNLPYVVLEMMQLSKIVLVSRQGGQAEIVRDGVNGFVFDHNDPASFAQKIQQILSLDMEAANAISINARNHVGKYFNYEVVFAQKNKIVQHVIKKAAKSTTFPFLRPVVTNELPRELSFKAGMLSIVIPFFNMGQYLPETIESLRATGIKVLHILIVNDGSTEQQSLEVLNRYRGMEGITVIDSANKGLAHARNLGAATADGEYLAFLDADDLISSDFYQRGMEVLSNYANVHFVGCWTQYFENSQKIWPTFTPEPPLILYHNKVNSSSLLYKRNSFLTAGKNDEEMAFPGLEDYDSVIGMVSSGFGGVVLPESLFKYRIRQNSMIRHINRSKKLILFEYIQKKHTEIYNSFAGDLYNLLNANGPGIDLDNPTLDYHLADKIPFGGKFSLKLISLIKKNKFIKTIAYKVYRSINK